MLCQFLQQGQSVKCSRCGLVLPHGIPDAIVICGSIPVGYPAKCGTELHALLRDWLGIEPTADCPCRSMAARMDRLGPDWCESDEGMAEILGVMRTEHGRRWADGRTILPWTDMGARQLVLLACRRARAKVDG